MMERPEEDRTEDQPALPDSVLAEQASFEALEHGEEVPAEVAVQPGPASEEVPSLAIEMPPEPPKAWWRRFLPRWEGSVFLLIVMVALGMRLWDLGGRAIHYDEAIHAHYAYLLATKWEYTHAAWNHGPFQYHTNALAYLLFGASDYTARLFPALFGAALVGLPYFFRRDLGTWGAVATALMLAFSPALLYFSRFIRNDIYIAFWTVAVLVLAWRYFHEHKNKYLYLGSAAVALAFTAKETAFIMVGLFVVVFGLMALPQFWSWVRYRTRFRDLDGPAGFVILMATLTLPQWMPALGLFQDIFNITLVNSNGAMGQVGMPLGIGIAVAIGLVAIAIIASIVVGVLWKGWTWLKCAVIYYFIWLLLFTTVFKNPLGGIMTGMWESMGYWIAQHGVQRGDQPWYFYLMMSLDYEFLPVLLAVPAIVYYTVRRDALGMALGLLSILTFAAYTYAGEKMPWIMVEVVVPFILLTGKFLGDLAMEAWAYLYFRFHSDRILLRVAVTGRTRLRAIAALVGDVGTASIVALMASIAVLGGWLLVRYLDEGVVDGASRVLLVSVAVLGALLLVAGWRAKWPVASRLGVLGLAALMLGFGAFVAGRASYTYNDAPIEMLVYAQGSYQMREVADQVRETMQEYPGGEVSVDYELWYPYQWYARDDAFVHYYCYKEPSEDGYVPWCKSITETPTATILLLNTQHGRRDAVPLMEYERRGEYWNLLWFPQVYRVPDVSSRDTMLGRWKKEAAYLWKNIRLRKAWDGFFDYLITRQLGSQWWFSDFYAYFPKGG